MIQVGPKDHWQAELDKVSKSGLIHLCESLMRFSGYRFGREELLREAQMARKHGRIIDAMNRHDRFMADPDAAMEATLRRRLGAVKAQRRRKKEKKTA